jgi:uncharacterized membrane protein
LIFVHGITPYRLLQAPTKITSTTNTKTSTKFSQQDTTPTRNIETSTRSTQHTTTPTLKFATYGSKNWFLVGLHVLLSSVLLSLIRATSTTCMLQTKGKSSINMHEIKKIT